MNERINVKGDKFGKGMNKKQWSIDQSKTNVCDLNLNKTTMCGHNICRAQEQHPYPSKSCGKRRAVHDLAHCSPGRCPTCLCGALVRFAI